jgi:hypothetical protein
VLLLDYRVVVLFLICVDLSQSQNLVARVLLFNGFDLTIVHVVDHDNLLLDEVHGDLGDLLLGRLFGVFLELTRHLLNAHLAHMVVIII